MQVNDQVTVISHVGGAVQATVMKVSKSGFMVWLDVGDAEHLAVYRRPDGSYQNKGARVLQNPLHLFDAPSAS